MSFKTGSRRSGIDVLKMVCAFFVVYIHFPLRGMAGNLLLSVTRVAVPIFLIITGFFYRRTEAKGGWLRQVLRLSALYIGACLLYLIAFILIAKHNGDSIPDLLRDCFSTQSTFRMLVLNQPRYATHLWYLHAAVYALLIFRLAALLHLRKPLLLVAPLLLIPGLALGKYSGIVLGRSFHLYFARNAYFTALPYFCIGYLLSGHIDALKAALSRRALALACIFFAACTMLEDTLLQTAGTTGDLYLSTAFLAVSLFLFFFLHCSGSSAPAKICAQIGRTHSLGIYILHPLTGLILHEFLGDPPFPPLYARLESVIIFSITLLLLILFRRLPFPPRRNRSGTPSAASPK